MDLRAQWSTPVQRGQTASVDAPAMDGQGTQVETLALRVGARLASVLALARLKPNAGDVAIYRRIHDTVAIQQRIHDTIESPRWLNCTAYMLFETCGRHHGRSRHHELLSLEEASFEAQKVLQRLRTIRDHTSAFVGGVSWWAALLALVNDLRRPSEPPRSPQNGDSLDVVARYLTSVKRAHEDAGRPEPYPPLYSRGGLDPDSAAAGEANHLLFDFYASLRPAVRRARLRSIGLFFAPGP